MTCLYRAYHLAYTVLSNMKDSEKQKTEFANLKEPTVSLGEKNTSVVRIKYLYKS